MIRTRYVQRNETMIDVYGEDWKLWWEMVARQKYAGFAMGSENYRLCRVVFGRICYQRRLADR